MDTVIDLLNNTLEYDNEHKIKFGYSDDYIKREKEHKQCFKNFNVIKIWDLICAKKAEQQIKTNFRSMKLITPVTIKNHNHTEIITLDEQKNLDYYLDTINNIINNTPEHPIVIAYKEEIEKCNEVIEKYNKIIDKFPNKREKYKQRIEKLEESINGLLQYKQLYESILIENEQLKNEKIENAKKYDIMKNENQKLSDIVNGDKTLRTIRNMKNKKNINNTHQSVFSYK